MMKKVDFVKETMEGIESGSIKYDYSHCEGDIFLIRPFREACFKLNSDLMKWRNQYLKLKKMTEIPEEEKKKFDKTTAVLYKHIIDWQSFGYINKNANKGYEEALALMEQRLESVKAERDKCKEENKFLVKKLSKSDTMPQLKTQTEIGDTPGVL